MPSVDSNSSYSSSDSSLSSPRALLTDIQHSQAIHQQENSMRSSTNNTSHVCVTRYKTELCRPFTETGKCKYGDKCQFSHGMKELRILMRHPKYKTEYCRTFHTTGYCPYGPRCHFIHDVHEARPTSNANETTTRRHSDIRTNHLIQKSTARNRLNSDHVTLSSSSHLVNNSTSSKLPFTFEELNQALLSYDIDEIFHQQQQQTQQHQDFYPSILSTMTNSLTHRTFSSSSSSNSSLAPQYI
ncbi:hypothetical protein I4U23_018291 [Adineta vaga]|nr:hypothetical protein I4U23_018291 [Adineta vaga]